MPKYPNINDDNFYDRINKIYKKYKVPKKIQTMENICMPKTFKLQLPQQFLADFMSPKTDYKGILVYHRIGAGKTCTAVRIAEEWKKHKRIIIVLPASLKGNFRTELRSLCADNNYLKPIERKELSKLHPNDKRYKEIMTESDKRIDKYYEIYSYNKFVESVNNKSLHLKNALLIVDEIQNMVSEDGTFYESLYNIIHKSSNDLRIVLLSATPMFDKPNELALTINLLRTKNHMPIGKEFNSTFIQTIKKSNDTFDHKVINLELLKQYIKGYVSFFRGAPPHVFPKVTIKFIKCHMSDFQVSAYAKILRNEEKEFDDKIVLRDVLKDLNISDLPNYFYIGTRMVSNIVYPNKKLGNQGLLSLTKSKILKNLEQYSVKFFEILNRIEHMTGKIFVYSAFKEFGGIKPFIKILEAYGYKDYTTEGQGKKRFAVLSGDESINIKERIKTVFNMKNNLSGKYLKIIIGSPATKEGISFYGVRQVHILEPYWNRSRLDQIIGRASRFCSHKDLSEEKRTVKVYIYLAVHDDLEQTIDQYMQQLIMQKSKIINSFETAIKESAIDCYLNQNANVDVDAEPINCDI
jgi:superfamily II DNA or RNA helicase